MRPRETIRVHAVIPDRDALEIAFPRVEGYRVELPEDRLVIARRCVLQERNRVRVPHMPLASAAPQIKASEVEPQVGWNVLFWIRTSVVGQNVCRYVFKIDTADA